MSSYRSAYENYYKNINNAASGIKQRNNYFQIGKKNSNYVDSRYGIKINSNSITNILIKRVTRELTGATILLFFFVGLKYMPSDQVRNMHIKCKQLLTHNFSCNEYIQAFNTLQIGSFKAKDLNIGNLTVDDLKTKVFNFLEYIKSSDNMKV